MVKEELSQLKTFLLDEISELRYYFNEVHDQVQWSEIEEIYPECSKVLRSIEKLEKIVNNIKNE